VTTPVVSRRDTNHLTAASCETLRALLLDELDVQTAIVAAQLYNIEELDGHTDTESTHARQIAERAHGRALEATVEIEHALARLAADDYGTCEACGRSIPFERLEAIPSARNCMACPPPRSLNPG